MNKITNLGKFKKKGGHFQGADPLNNFIKLKGKKVNRWEEIPNCLSNEFLGHGFSRIFYVYRFFFFD